MKNFSLKSFVFLLITVSQLIISSPLEASIVSSLNLKEFSTRLLFSTIKVTSTRKDGYSSYGSAYFFDFQTSDEKLIIPAIITNKHVIERSVQIQFLLREAKVDKDGNSSPSDISHEVIIENNENEWICHPTMDLCALPCAFVFEAFNKKYASNVFYFGLREEIIPTQEQLNNLGAIESVSMIGYPIGLWDQGNNLPIMRRGNTASHPAVDFNNTPEGLVDIAAYPGSSGSPILLLDKITEPQSNNSILFQNRIWFIGTLWGGPTHSTSGQIQFSTIPMNVPTVTIPFMIHLGYYIKSKEVLTLKSMILKKNKL